MCFVTLENSFDEIPCMIAYWIMRKENVCEAFDHAVMTLCNKSCSSAKMESEVRGEFLVAFVCNRVLCSNLLVVYCEFSVLFSPECPCCP